MRKADYKEVAAIINEKLEYARDKDFDPRVTVVDTADRGFGFDKYSLRLNDDLYDLIEYKGKAQDMFYANEVFIVGDRDYYLEPVTKTYWGLAW